jgi:hypothetical protein
LKEHHEHYNIHLGHVNKKLNDKKEEDCKAEEAKKTSGVEDLSDVLLMIQNKVKPSMILLGEFQSIGELQPHIITQGKYGFNFLQTAMEALTFRLQIHLA